MRREGSARIHIRCCQGTEVPDETAMLVETVTDPEQTTYATSSMSTPEQGTWTFRVWVVDVNGHIAATNPVTISRPA